MQVGFPGVPPWGEPAVVEARAVSAVCDGVRMWSVYVPNGRAIGDPHYDYKLEWLAALRDYGAKELAADQPHAQIAFCGDYNIAPTDDDIWSVEYYRHSHAHHPARAAAFAQLVDAGFTDVVRPHTPGPGVYTYWDYTQLSFQKRRACGSTSRWPARAGGPGDRTRSSTARSARARARPTTRRWSSKSRP